MSISNKSTPRNAMDDIDALMHTIKEVQGRQEKIATDNSHIKALTEKTTNDNKMLAEHLRQEAKKYSITEPQQKSSFGSNFVENHKVETGKDLSQNPSREGINNNPGDGDFGQTENSKGKEQSDNAKMVRSEVPLLSADTVIGIGDKLKGVVFGQENIIEEIEDGLVVNTVNLNLSEEKPVGCYLFAGPSGVGKTELCIQLAKFLGVEILVVNMGEHSLAQDVTKLIGVASGYVGYANGGLVTNFVRANPRSIVVFDELEKAHEDINKILLSIMDKGVCRDNKNREIFFNETIFIATTNLGANVEYATHLTAQEKFEYRMEAIKEKFAPEIINRYDSVFQFNSLTPEIYANIVRKFTNSLSEISLKRNQYAINSSDELIQFVTEHSYDPAMGGRPARRFIEKIVLKPLAYKLLDKTFVEKIKEHGSLDLNLKDGKIIFTVGDEQLGSLDNTMDLVTQYKKGKFSSTVEEVEASDLSDTSEKIAPSLENPSKPKSKKSKDTAPKLQSS